MKRKREGVERGGGGGKNEISQREMKRRTKGKIDMNGRCVYSGGIRERKRGRERERERERER